MPRPADPSLRDRLIASATIEFAESGYSGTTLDGVAARAGVTKGGLYFHFAGKEELFFSALDHWREHRARLGVINLFKSAAAACTWVGGGGK